jgi:hypothetical protein
VSRLQDKPIRTSRQPLLLFLFLLAFCSRLIFLHAAGNNTTDAWSRYHYAMLWLQHPLSLPQASATDAWLPLHFWLLGAAQWLTKSDVGVRVFTAVLGALTVLFFCSIVARSFDRRNALASALVLAFFGFHIAFSVTTSSEAPTIFLIAAGIYGWVRFASGADWKWGVFSAVMFGAASLCRFEAWLCAPVLGLMLLDAEPNAISAQSRLRPLGRAAGFAVLGSAAAIGWLIFSFIKWGDALELPHRTMWLNLHFRAAVLHHSLIFRLFEVPASLLITLNPLVVVLACIGLFRVFTRGMRPARGLAVLTFVLFAFNYWNSMRYEATQARYTLMYSWLLIPFAFEGLHWLGERWPRLNSRAAYTTVVIFFVLWQAGIVAGATYGPPKIADRLSQMSPTVPPHHEMRELTNWLLKNHPSGPAILDDFNWESPAVIRITRWKESETFEVTAEHYKDPQLLKQELEDFVQSRHPDLLVVSPYGPIGNLWSVADRDQFEVENLGIQLQRKWTGEHWRIYAITYQK